jgi:hypothetical protein
MQSLLENPDNYFDDEERAAYKVYKRFIKSQLDSFLKGKDGKWSGHIYYYKGLQYHIELIPNRK